MAVSAADVRKIQDSLPKIREQIAPASSSFYENLFAIAPELRALFRGDLNDQGMRFMATLATIADLLDDPETLGPELESLARAHAGIGVRAAHFAPMGSALMVTLGETLGPAFTPDLHAAWRAAYDNFAGEMIARGELT